MAEKVKKAGGGLKGWVRRHKVLTVLLVLVLVIALVVAWFMSRAAAAVSAAANYQFVRTTTLSKDTLSESVTVNGTVKSGEEASVTVSDGVKTYKVATVNVAVGDTVKQGDVIATLDTTDLEKSIADAQQDYQDTLQKAQTTYNRAAEDYEVELVKHQNELIDLQEEIDRAQEDLNEITENYNNTDPVYDVATDNYARVEYYYNLYKDRIAEAEAAVATKNAEYEQALIDNGDVGGNNQEFSSESQSKQEELAVKNAELEKLKSECSAPELGLYSWDEIVSAYKNIDQLQQSLEKAYDNYDDTKNYPSSLKNAYTSLIDATTSLQQAKRTPSNLTDLQASLADCTLTATMDGTITALNATVGSVCSGTVATIQDVDDLTVEVTIPAANVSKLSPGMNCIITSDATGAAEVSGTLTRIDPVANENGSFGATVTVYGDSAGLLIGIQAEVEIVISAKDGVFMVPIDAVGTNEDGTTFVYRSTGGSGVDMTFEQVEVTTGDQNDYYIEISGDDLAEGDVIRSSSDLEEGIETATTSDSASLMFNMGGGGGGMGGGDMGGGGNMGGGAPPSGGGGGAPGGM